MIQQFHQSCQLMEVFRAPTQSCSQNAAIGALAACRRARMVSTARVPFYMPITAPRWIHSTRLAFATEARIRLDLFQGGSSREESTPQFVRKHRNRHPIGDRKSKMLCS